MVILPHGALELSAIVIAGGAGLIVGYGLWAPGQRTRLRALREDVDPRHAVGRRPGSRLRAWRDCSKAWLLPATPFPKDLKVVLGIAVAVIFWLYLLVAGRGRDSDSGQQKHCVTRHPKRGR